ncbi:MAG: hypothetical protein PHO37_15515 [Kiritimatiellae bacterium]|nr:hypothetical protein [Kiritimatiellia bacterium]
MKRLITIALLAIFAGCSKPPQSVAIPAESKGSVLSQLKAELPKASVLVQKQKIDLEVQWMNHSSARMCSRPLNINLADNKIGAFVHPIQNLNSLTGASLQDVVVAFESQVEAYLKKNKIPETRIQAGDDIGNYMEENAEQTN